MTTSAEIWAREITDKRGHSHCADAEAHTPRNRNWREL